MVFPRKCERRSDEMISGREASMGRIQKFKYLQNFNWSRY